MEKFKDLKQILKRKLLRLCKVLAQLFVNSVKAAVLMKFDTLPNENSIGAKGNYNCYNARVLNYYQTYLIQSKILCYFVIVTKSFCAWPFANTQNSMASLMLSS